MVRCINCGAELQENAKFCSNCATPVAVQPSGRREMISPGAPPPRALARYGVIVVWVIISALIAVAAGVFIREQLGGLLYYLLGSFYSGLVPIVIVFSILQAIMYKSGLLSSRRWHGHVPPPPAEGKQSLLERCQRGVFDLRTGNLEATARNVNPPTERLTGYSYRGEQKINRVVRFRAELMNSKGDIERQIPVAIECNEKDWVGEIAEGDMFTVKGTLQQGILVAERAFNVTTNSVVGRG